MATKRDYKTEILAYLKSHPGENISRDELIKKTGISKPRLSEVLKSIREDGYSIISPPRSGYVRLEPNEEEHIFPQVRNRDIRQWIILYLLSQYGKMTFNELLLKMLGIKDHLLEDSRLLTDEKSEEKAYDNATIIRNLRNNVTKFYNDDIEDVARDIISVTALREDLTQLRNLKQVRMDSSDQVRYSLTKAAPHFVSASNDSLYEFCQQYEDFSSAIGNIAPLKDVYLQIKTQINYEGTDIQHHRFGKTNVISQIQIDYFNQFIANNYKAHLLELVTEYGDGEAHTIFATGLLYYSVETGFFYALGKNISMDRIETRRLDRIKRINTLAEKNTEFHKKKYEQIYREMFSSAYEETAHHVKVLFADIRSVRERFGKLAELRNTASIRRLENPLPGTDLLFVYEDKIRGLEDFARYLRVSGRAVLAISPPELVNRMKETYMRIEKNYA